jgi:hypothetical protein
MPTDKFITSRRRVGLRVMIDIKQSTIEEIIDSEELLAIAAPERYGMYYLHARNVTTFFSKCLSSIDPGYDFFAGFYAHVKKHHLLALLSTVRLHHVQTQMNIRQVVEGGAWATYALAHTEARDFVHIDKRGILRPTTELSNKRDQWLTEKFSKNWSYLRGLRSQINKYGTHANLVVSSKVLRQSESGREWNMPFFDFTDDYYVYTDLWSIAGIGISLMDLFLGANESTHIHFVADFDGRLTELLHQNQLLQQEMHNTDRFKQMQEKFGDDLA